jgi:hypothetical protein
MATTFGPAEGDAAVLGRSAIPVPRGPVENW